MSTPQDSPKRKKQKARRSKQLAAWREKKATEGAKAPAKAPAKKAAAAPKAAPKKESAKK